MRLPGVTFTTSYVWSSRWVLAVLSGILLGLSFPPLDLPLLQILAFVLLFRLADLSRSYREAAYWSFVGFLTWNLMVTYWMMMATAAGGIAANLANSALMTLPFVFQRYILRRRCQPLIAAFLLSSVWVGYEYLHHLWDLAWPWLALGNGWANYPPFIQYISFTGHLGISFWVLFVSSLFYIYLTRLKNHRTLWYGVAALILPPCLSLFMFYGIINPISSTSKKAQVIIAQPDFDSYATHYGYSNPVQPLQELADMSDSLLSRDTDAVIWPENAIQPYIGNERMNNSHANKNRRLLSQLSSNWNVPIITGATYYEYLHKDTLSDSRLVRQPDSYKPYLYYNAALGFYPDHSIEVYKKVHLVPMVERIPFLTTLHKFDPFGIPWHDLPWYGKGNSYTQFSITETRTPALVCYDSVFPHWMRGFINRGAGFLTIITNDGWWGDTGGHLQHFAFARLRAIEFRRWVARSANNGISGVISPDGSVVKQTAYGTRTVFSATIPIRSDRTFFARYGAWLPWMSLIIFSLGYAYFLIRSYRNRDIEF